jgi:hypothetical protein
MASWQRLLGGLAMTLVSLVVAHNLVFLATYGAGYDDALVESGHGGAWGSAVAVILAAGAGLLGLAVWRLRRLGLLAREVAPAGARLSSGPGQFAPRLVRLWLRLSTATALLFVIQENLEHRLTGEALPGLAVLGSAEYPDAWLIIAGVALAVAFVGALFAWRRDLLIARIAAGLRHLHRRSVRVAGWPVADRDGRPDSIVGRGRAVRAPPPLPAS